MEDKYMKHEKYYAMMCLVKEAKYELLKEKMKKKLELSEGKKLDEMANLMVEAVMEKHKGKMEFMRKKEETRKKLESAFMQY